MLVVMAKDDPFIDYQTYEKAPFSSSTLFLPQDHGGHMGYVSKAKTPLGNHRWQDYAVDAALKFLT